MNKRAIILISALVVTFILMVLFTRQVNNIEELMPSVIFGLVLVVLAIDSLKAESNKQSKTNAVKLLFASFAVAVGLIIIISVLALPFIGFSSFELVAEKSFIYILFALTAIAYPIVAKYLK